MPINIDEEFIHDLVKRQIAAEQMRERFAPREDAGSSVAAQTSLNPTLVSILGPLADAASTYSFLKRGSAVEENPAFAGLPPGKAALAVAGGGLMIPLLMRALRGRVLPEQFTDAIGSNTGAASLGAAATNFEGTQSTYDKVYGLLGNLNRINNREEPRIPSLLSRAHSVAHNRAIYGDRRNTR